ncbi:MAG: hypothetical protein Q9195_005263 [Heterodermia aff. obscurata]
MALEVVEFVSAKTLCLVDRYPRQRLITVRGEADIMSPTMPQPGPILAECEGFDCPSTDEAPKSLCLSCRSTACDFGWDQQGPHRPGKVGLDGLPHEKTGKQVYDRLKVIFEPPEGREEFSRLHIKNEDTTWFAVEKDTGGQPIFQDYGRYSSRKEFPDKDACLAQRASDVFNSNLPFRSPVIGSLKNDKSPTSADVHLYVDPETAYGPLPLLYADCEGLEGGETAPRESQLRDTMRKSRQGPIRPHLLGARPKELIYAKKNSEAQNRECVVCKVYPRLLYTFSDVVVFVLCNTRTFQSSALKLLLEWASTSVELSINAPALTHAIIVLNDSKTLINEEEWDSSIATKNLKDHIADAIFDVVRNLHDFLIV